MIDWHSHILPGMDDGSKDFDESIAMLEALKLQGVDTVIATPHFHANGESLESFLARRKKSYDSLCAKVKSDDVRIICAAEVKYYPGISRMEGLEHLSIGETNLLLLEMPFARWTDHTVGEIYELSNMRGFKVILAHIERYCAMQDKRLPQALVDSGILLQSNASFFTRFGTKRKAIKLLGSGGIHFLGSDCHNMTSRPPNLDSAYKVIGKKLGDEFLTRMSEYGYQALKYKNINFT